MTTGTLVALWLLSMLAQGPAPVKLGDLHGISQPHSLHVVGHDLVFLDGFTVHVYSLDSLEPRWSFGGEGDRPDQFKYWPQLILRGDTVIGTDFLKTSWFSLQGTLLKTIPYTDFADFNTNMEMVLIPVGENFIRITADHASSQRFVRLYDQSLHLRTPLYEGLYDWRGALPPYRIDVDSDAEHILVSDSEKGFFLRLFDTEGTLLRTIDKSGGLEPVAFSETDRSAYLESVRLNDDPRLYEHLRQNARFKDQFPMLNHAQVDDGRLYVTTERTRDGNHEMVVLDLEGRIEKTLFLPLRSKSPARRILRFDPYVVHQGKLYELVRGQAAGVYELWVTDLN